MIRHYAMHNMLSAHSSGGKHKRHGGAGHGNGHGNGGGGGEHGEGAFHHGGPHHGGHKLHAHGRSRSAAEKHMGGSHEHGDMFPSPMRSHRHVMTPVQGHHEGHLKGHDMTLYMQLIDFERFIHTDPISEMLKSKPTPKHAEHHVAHHAPTPVEKAQKIQAMKDSRGEVLLSLCYSPNTKKLSVVVMRARDLPRKDLTTFADPCIKLTLLYNGNKMDKKKTTVKSQTCAPIFHECFSFFLPPDKLKESQLLVSVLDFDLINKNHTIGHMVFGEHGSNEAAEKHWKDVLARPGYPMSMWHRLESHWH